MTDATNADPVDYEAFHTAFNKWRTFLGRERLIQAADFEKFYQDNVATVFNTTPGLKPAVFDTEQFPSLFSDLPIHSRDHLHPINKDRLPTSWTPVAITVDRGISDLSRLLLAFIWKQGDLKKVNHVLAGLRSLAPPTDKRVVMWQFGCHLRDPLNEPIFDQHSARHQLLLAKSFVTLSTFTEYRDFFVSAKARGGARIPLGQAALTTRDRLDAFLTWWRATLGDAKTGHLPSDQGDRANAILWSDRIMFSLGKAAALVLSNHAARSVSPAGAT